MSEITNVGRMVSLYKSKINDPIYIAGAGTTGVSESKDNFNQSTGYDIDDKQYKAYNKLLSRTLDSDNAKEFLFFPIDFVSFSRGSTTASDFINKINNENYWNIGILTRSHFMFDPVGSYDIAGNGVDIGRDFSTPKNIIATQINAKNDTRNLFDSQVLYTSTGENPSPNNWTQIDLLGAHADVGGGYAKGYQGKTQDMALYSMQLMIESVQEHGIEFKPVPQNQKPEQEFNQLMNYYNEAEINLGNNSAPENQSYFNSIEGLIKANYVHDSTYTGTGKLYNYSIGDERGRFYPNDKYLKDLAQPELLILE